MPKNQGRVLSATTTKKTSDFGDPHGIFSLLNDGAGSIFIRQQDEGRIFAGTIAEIYALGGGRLKPGEPVTMKGITWDYVCASDDTDGTTATGRVLPGIVGTNLHATVNLGANIGLLDKAESEIDPAINGLQIERYLEVDELNGTDIADWAKGTDMEDLASSAEHIPHETKLTSIEINKSGSSTKTTLMTRTVAIDASAFKGLTQLEWAVKSTAWTNIAYMIIRLGTSASHYHEWKVDPDTADFSTTHWVRIGSSLAEATQTGNGLSMGAIAYIALGVEMTGTQAAAQVIQFDEVRFVSAPLATPGTPIVVDPGNVANAVRIAKIGSPSNGTVATDAGAVGNDVQRMTLGSDDPAVQDLDKLAATGATALETAATTGVGTIDTIALTANTIYVDISFDTAAHYATPGASAPTTLYGAKYYPGITYRIQTFKTTNLYVESAGAAGEFHVTCYTH